jgi:nucleotide-binding universal stress UspA family protein
MSDPILVGVDTRIGVGFIDLDEGRAALHAAAALATAAGATVKAESEVVVGDPADALIALSHEVDLLVCGSRGYGPLRAVLLGGVTHRLMRAAHCPVMILPRDTEQQLERLVERQNATTT